MTVEILAGILIPFAGTSLGAAMALVCKRNVSRLANGLLCGFAAGVMLAASVWSLIIPGVEMCAERNEPFVPVVLGFLAGIGGLLTIDALLPDNVVRKNKMMVFAVTVHNIPEGMAVGAVFAGLMSGSSITFAAALSLSVGIALQNIPEGAIVGMPLVGNFGRIKAFCAGVFSGIVEPIAALVTIALYVAAVAVLPYLLAMAAGAMIYVAAKELIPETKEGIAGIMGLSLGFVLMMILDLTL